MSKAFGIQIVIYFITLSLYLLDVNSCTLGEFPSERVSLAKGTFITYNGCESSDGLNINNYLLHLDVRSGTQLVKLDLQPYLIEQVFSKNASIVLSTSHPVTWIIRTHHVTQLQNIRIYFSQTSSVTAPSDVSLNPGVVPSNFAESLNFASQLLNNITLAATSSSANYILLQLGTNSQFTIGVQNCTDLTSVINTTSPNLFISQRLKVYDRSSDLENDAIGCINGFEDQVGNTMVIGLLLNKTDAPFNPFGFANAKPEVNLFFIADHIQQQRIDLILLSTGSVKWNIYQIGFQHLFINIKIMDGSEAKVISNSLNYMTTSADPQFSYNPDTLLSQLRAAYDEVNLFLNAEVPDEIAIDFNDPESQNETNYSFHQFLTDTVVYEYCDSDTYLFCLEKSTIDILSQYSFQLIISNDTTCRNSDGYRLPCTLSTSNNLTNPLWSCYEVRASDNQQQTRKYSTEVRLETISSTSGDNQSSDSFPLERRSLPESPIKRAKTLLGFLGSVGVLRCTSIPDPPTLLPPNNFSIQVINDNTPVVTYPAYINHGASVSTRVKLSDVPPGMQPFFLSCYITSSSSPRESVGFQHAIMQIIESSCLTREGRLFKISARSTNSYLTNELALELSLVNSLEPFLVDSRKAILLDNSYLHCQPSLCQSAPAGGERHSENTGYPMCMNLTSLCDMSTNDESNLINVYPNLYGSPHVSTGKLIFNTHNKPATTTPMSNSSCVTDNTSSRTESTISSTRCNFEQSVYTVWPLFFAFFAMMPMVYTCGGLMFCLLSRCARDMNNSNIPKSNKKRRLSLE